jgi:2-amino-4-hydroxy-6-hydroxymethyldihydropteridine diphosphokinase
LRAALDELRQALGPLEVAPLYRSRPVSPVPQPDFLNTVVLAACSDLSLSPEIVLGLAKALELAAGRRRGVRFGPRPLDIDLLLWGDRVQNAPELTLPHPRLRERRFVLAPLADLAPDLPVPPDGTPVRALLQRLEPGSEPTVERLVWSPA